MEISSKLKDNAVRKDSRKSSTRKIDRIGMPVQEGNQLTGAKSVFGRWLKDLRPANRDVKVHHPLGRTLSANVKDKDRKKKLGRSLSANQKDRKKDYRELYRSRDECCDLERSTLQSSKEKCRTYGDKYPREDVGNQWKREKNFENLQRIRGEPDGIRRRNRYIENGPAINRSALVSYLDEEGLNGVEGRRRGSDANAEGKREAKSHERNQIAKQDGSIMPTSSIQQQKPKTNHYENHENIVLNERNQLKIGSNRGEVKQSDYTRIEYVKYPHESKKNPYSYYNSNHDVEHKYENLKNPIHWEGEKKLKESSPSSLSLSSPDGNADEDKDALISIKNLENLVESNRECSFQFGYGDGGGLGEWSRSQDAPEAPVRDPSSLKSIKYGPGHEKYPSWPGSVRTEGGDKPQRSHSWTDQTSYPKEKVTTYVRPYSMRANPAFTQQLKTVMERCEKISPETYQKTMEHMDERENRLYLPRVDREGKSLGDQDYMVPSPPERDKPSLTQADLEKYYQENHHMTKIDNGDYSTPYEDIRKGSQLTRADLEEYARSYDEVLKPHHQHQGSYAQSEGYHSYVSSSELTTTPFLDRLRRESDSGIRNQQWEEEGRAGRDSVVTTSSGSASSSETLKWHGSMSDVSVASSSCRSRQLIAHSSRVPPPQRHHSESVLYLGNQSPGQNGSNWQSKSERSQQLKLFPVNTYTVQPNEQSKPVISPTSVPQLSVAERISELERQQQAQRYAYLDPDKRHRVSDPTLKAIQKKALLSFYERHQHSNAIVSGSVPVKGKENWKSEPQLSNQDNQQRSGVPPPPPPPRPSGVEQSSKRASCSSDLSVGSWGKPSHQYSCSLLGPVIVGPSISVDDWVPERPPKKPHLRTVPPPIPQRTPSPVQVPPPDQEVESLHAFHKFLPCYDRMPTPDLPPPPPPPPPSEDDPTGPDEPLPPPPPEIEWHLATAVPRRTTPISSGPASPQSPVQYSPVKDCPDLSESMDNRKTDQSESLGALLITSNEALKSAYEIQYDQNAINAIMESNRLSKELHKRKYQSKHRDHDQEKCRSHIENRPPLPLPRDVHEPTIRDGSDGSESSLWRKSNEKSKPETKKSTSQFLESNPNNPFVRNYPKTENGTFRGSVKCGKTDSNGRSSLRYPSKKLVANGHGMKENPEKLQRSVSENQPQSPPPPVAPKTGKSEAKKPFAVKKVSEYESRIPIRDRDGLSVFERRFPDERQPDCKSSSPGHQQLGSNSKAAFLAVRREKELGLMNFEGSYKLTMTQSGESIEPRNAEKAPLEIVKMKEKSTENLVLDNRLSLEPPDLIPKIGNLNRKASSVQDVRDTAKKYDYNRFSNEKYRLLPSYHNNNNNISNNNINNRVSCDSLRIQPYGLQNEVRTIAEDGGDGDRYRRSSIDTVRTVTATRVECDDRLTSEPFAEKKTIPTAYRSPIESRKSTDEEEERRAEEEGEELAEGKNGENYGISLAVREIEANEKMEKEKVVTLQRVSSAQEKRSNRPESTESKVERSKSLKLVERSTSFGRTDTMKFVQRPEKSNLIASVSDASSQTEIDAEEKAREEARAEKAVDGDREEEEEEEEEDDDQDEQEEEEEDEEDVKVVDETAQRKMEEEMEYERLSRDLASQLSPSDKLQGLLVPDSERKKPTDYVVGLFCLEITSRPRKPSVKKSKSTESTGSTTSSSPENSIVNGVLDTESERVEALPPSSPYFTTSEPKAKMLTRYTDSMDSLGLRDSQQLQKKKEELMARLDKKLEVLREEQLALMDECSANDELGATVANSVAKLARPHEAVKYRLHVEEVGKITSLLLGLSGRLARAENALIGLPSHHDERKIHESKRDKLQEQLEEAKQLKESIDKRSESIAKTLGKCLSPEEFADYVHFIQMKAKLIVDSREIADKISLGEEQLAALKETLSS